MKTRTELQIEYAFLSWDYDFLPNIEVAIKNDYVANPHLYNNTALKRVATLLLMIAADAPAECALNAVRSCSSDSVST